MPLEPHEELKLAWEIALMDMQIDRGRLDIERVRQEMDESHIKVGKVLLDMEKTREDMVKNRMDMEKTREDIVRSRVDMEKTRADMALDIDRLKTQNWTMVATMIGAFAATLAAGAAIGHFFIK